MIRDTDIALTIPEWVGRTKLLKNREKEAGIVRFHQMMMRARTDDQAEVDVAPVLTEQLDSRVSAVLAIFRTRSWNFDAEGNYLSFPQRAEILSGIFGIHLETTINFFVSHRFEDEENETISEDDLLYLATTIVLLLHPGMFRQLPSVCR